MSAVKNEVAAASAKKLLALVAAMNDLSENIDPSYAKIALFLKTGEKQVTRYFIKKRTYLGEDGIERWKFIAREDVVGAVETEC